MPNPVFQLTARSLSKVVSGRAAETMLTAALHDLKLSPETVTARDMQRVLSGPLERRLSQVMPDNAAFEKLRALSRRLERQTLASSTLFDKDAPTVIWDQDGDTQWAEDEFGEAALGTSESTSSGSKATSPQPFIISDTPQPPRLAAAPPVTSYELYGEARLQPSVEPGVHSSAPPAAPPPPPTPKAYDVSENNTNGPDQRVSEQPSDDWSADGFSAEDFEFSDPDYVHLQAASKTYQLSTPQGQDALLYELARHAGVQTVVLCSTDGRVISVRAPQGAPQLGSVVAATALLFRQRDLKLLSADLGNATVCMRVVGGYCVALLARGSVNVGRLLSELQQIEVAA